jgi:hypothetical protein
MGVHHDAGCLQYSYRFQTIPDAPRPLTGAVAVAIPAPAIALPAANPDADLLELGRKLDELLAAEADALIRAQPNWNAWRDVLRGFKARHAAGEGHITNEEYMAAGAEVDRQFPIAAPTPDDVTDAIGPIAESIMAHPAHSLAGLCSKGQTGEERLPRLLGPAPCRRGLASQGRADLDRLGAATRHGAIMTRDDQSLRRLAVQRASQLPEDRAYCLKVIEYLRRQVIEFLNERDGEPPPFNVTPLRPVS